MKKIFNSRISLIAMIVLLGFMLRSWAALQLPVDADEPVYMQAAYDYSQMIRSGDWKAILAYRQNLEHPPLVKLLFSVPELALPAYAGWADSLLWARLISVFFGTLAVLVLTLLDPLAGGLLAIHTMTVKYTAEAYLEAVPLFASLVAVSALYTSRKPRDPRFWLSAVALGVIPASKYSYFPILFVIGFLFLFEKKYAWRDLALYLILAVVVFFALDPALWLNPIGSLAASIRFHSQYAQSAHVQEVGYPWYQPLSWISKSWPNIWHPQVFFFFSADGAIFLLSLAGLALQWRQRRWVIVWAASSFAFLLLWPTRWPQYTLVLAPALCLSASAALRWMSNWIREQEDYWGWFSIMIPNPTRVVILAVAGIFSALVIFFIINTVNITLNHRGWTHLSAEMGGLPSNAVYDLLSDSHGRMLVGTGGGALIWQANPTNPSQGQMTLFNHQNSSLPDDEVFSLAIDAQGAFWFGTRAGLARFAEGKWAVFHASDFGLAGEEVHAIAVDRDGSVWIGTNFGVAFYDGQSWKPLELKDAGLEDRLVFSIAVQPQSAGEWVWLGTAAGLACWDASLGQWCPINLQEASLGSGGIPALQVDGQGRLWVASIGSGLNMWDGDNWFHYRISNSGLPTNVVQSIWESQQGDLWVATAYHDRPGGLITRFDGKNWQTYQPYYTGYSGAETVSIAQDALGRLWFGTLTAGIDIYQPKK
jgi:Two component regulator propeller